MKLNKKRKLKPSKILGAKGNLTFLTGAMVREEDVEVPAPRQGAGLNKETVKHLILYATNRWTFMRVSLGSPDKQDSPGPIPLVAVKELEAGTPLALGEDTIEGGGVVTYQRKLADGVSDSKTYPDWHEVHPGEVPEEHRLTVGFSPQLLLDLATAMGEKHAIEVVLDLRETKPMEDGGEWYAGKMGARPGGHVFADKPEGLIMPRRPIGAKDG